MNDEKGKIGKLKQKTGPKNRTYGENLPETVGKLELAWTGLGFSSAEKFAKWVKNTRLENAATIKLIPVLTLRTYSKEGIQEKRLHGIVNFFYINVNYWVSVIDPEEFKSKILAAFVKRGIQVPAGQEISGNYQDNSSQFQPRYIPSKNQHFTGRKDILTKLDEELLFPSTATPLQRKIAVLSGLGGMGKTQIAQQFANQNLDEFTISFWIKASSKEEINSNYRKLGEALGTLQNNEKDDLVREQICRYLEQPEQAGWLLIFDDVDKFEEFPDLLPQRGGSILVTTRQNHWNQVRLLKVEKFELTESLDLLRKVSDRENMDGADVLAKEFDHFPLALAQAGSFIRHQPRFDFQNYQKMFLKKRNALWKREKAPDSYHATVATTWNITRDAIIKELPKAEELLQLISFLHGNDIPYSLLEPWIANTEKLDEADVEWMLNDCVTKLDEYSMVGVKRNTVSVHKMVQTVVRDSLDKNKKKSILAQLLAIFCQKFPLQNDKDIKIHEWSRMLILHAEEFLYHLRKFDNLYRSVVVAFLLVVIGKFIEKINTDFNKAYKFYTEALNIQEKKLCFGGTPCIAASHSDIGTALSFKSKFHEAMDHHQKALKISEDNFGSNSVKVAKIFRDISHVLSKQGKHSNAMAYHQKALKIFENKCGNNSVEVAKIFTDIGHVLREQGKHSDAMAYHQKALKISEDNFGSDSVQIAGIFIDIGLVLSEQGKHSDSMAYRQQALKIYEDKTGNDSVQWAITFGDIGYVLSQQEKYSEAITHHQKSMKIFEDKFGNDNVHVAVSFNHIGDILSRQGKHSDAIAYHQKALKIYEDKLGDDSIEVAQTYNNIGAVFREQNNFPKALSCFKKAFGIIEKEFGKDNIHTARLYYNFGVVYKAQNKQNESISNYQKSLEIWKERSGEGNFEVGKIHESIGGIFKEQGKLSKALAHCRKSLSILEKQLGRWHVDIANIYEEIGHILLKQAMQVKQLSEIIYYYQTALKIREKQPSKRHDMARNHDNVGFLLEGQGNFPAALIHRQKAWRYRKRALGESHVDTTKSYYELAKTYRDTSKMCFRINYQSVSFYGRHRYNHEK